MMPLGLDPPSTCSIKQPLRCDAVPSSVCATEENLGCFAALRVGLNGMITIWKPFSNILIFVSYEFKEDRAYVREATQRAGNAWNATILDPDDGRPRFSLIDSMAEATCVVSPRDICDEDPNRDALSFFPGQRSPRILLYSKSLKGSSRPILEEILIHEFGHVQGARHYFAPLEDKQRRTIPAVLIGTDDDLSVMNYFELPNAPRIQKSDVDAMRQLYSLQGDAYKGLQLRRIDVVPMRLQSTQSAELVSMELASPTKQDPSSHTSHRVLDGERIDQTDRILLLVVLILVLVIFCRSHVR
ncbi:hypothetical protein B0J11DRAFT_540284 [Dendryphion nanum]|uniref:Peptidase M10 metallopeptidase domain-containing protein n=1 Tax=Dendryphion nanum TaxID=256645 RepID=A0A9P9D9Y9_9PLEO|nr:hypothetical protein B0J11DRAFT_540284 [Dendryphion nanum]